MRLEQLRYFITVCDKRSINLASKELFITQQSLSSSINHLEKEVGDKLLVRTNRGVYPTELGKRVYAFARQTLQEWRDIQHAATGCSHPEVHGHFDMLSTYNFLRTFLTKFSYYGLTQFPNIQSSGSVDNYDNILTALHRQRIDFAFVTLATYEDLKTLTFPDDLTFTPLFSCALYALVNVRSPLARKPFLKLDDILGETIALPQESDFHLYRPIFRERHKDFLNHLTVYKHMNMVFEFVYQNNAITLDVQMGPYGLSSQHLLNDKITSLPVLSQEAPFHIYGGYLMPKTSQARPLLETILKDFL